MHALPWLFLNWDNSTLKLEFYFMILTSIALILNVDIEEVVAETKANSSSLVELLPHTLALI